MFSLVLVLLSIHTQALRVSKESVRYAYVTMSYDASDADSVPADLKESVRLNVVSPNRYKSGTHFHPYIDPWNLTKNYTLNTRQQRSQSFFQETHESDSDERGLFEEPSETSVKHGPRISTYQAAEHIAADLVKVKSRYPLIVLTNLKDRLAKGVDPAHPNMIPISMNERFFTNWTCKSTPSYVNTIQKVAAFSLSDYDKLIWVDEDVTIMRNPDSLFDTQMDGGIWGMRSDMWCDYVPNFQQPERWANRPMKQQHHDMMYFGDASHDLATSVMLIEPTVENYDGIRKMGRDHEFCGTDQELIADHYWRKSPEKVHYFPADVAMYGRCFDGSITPMFKHKPAYKGWGTPTADHRAHGRTWWLKKHPEYIAAHPEKFDPNYKGERPH